MICKHAGERGGKGRTMRKEVPVGNHKRRWPQALSLHEIINLTYQPKGLNLDFWLLLKKKQSDKDRLAGSLAAPLDSTHGLHCSGVPCLPSDHTFHLSPVCFLPGSCPHLNAALKKEFTGPGLHLRPVCADRAWPPLQWTLSSVLSACGNDKGRIRPPLGRGILKKRKQTLITPASRQCLPECNHRLIGY